MDEFLITIAFLLFYLLVQLLGRKKKAPRPPTPGPEGPTHVPAEGTVEPSLDDALQEIRQMLGMPSPEPTLPPPRPEPAQRPVEPPRRKPAPPPPLPSEFHPQPSDFSAEQAFERRPAFSEAMLLAASAAQQRAGPTRPVAGPKARSLKEVFEQPEAARPEPGHTLLHHLRDRQSAREAILLSEILGPPRAHRRR